ncbi:SURF1 family protein [Pseudaminobacter soli (ex Li et al. 2025)]|uniref:SURF1-like protein n=1 Tax=Pseudaminobacter soli (ex Li et al. 2025) TaxID=1295366 RepID=A0A2P7SGA3_9HYPH|nr:SURF1 family protein [Mesorhizobium soli]PSJ61536.1 hypothetical protein C7I85_10850 [Mesorhizobium soli]
MSPATGAGRTKVEAEALLGDAANASARSVGKRSVAARLLLVLLALCGIAAFTALGIWQLERRVWKLDLIARVDERIHAPAADAPSRGDWPAINAADYEYRHVRLTGHFLDQPGTLVRAVTDLGSGYWVLAPMRTDDGFIVLVNRGFIPPERKAEFGRAESDSKSATVVTGLLRMSEPGGGFLRKNDPVGERWYSRDVAAIAAAHGLADVAPYFVDAEASGQDSWPRGGLTVVQFRNSHLVYALTWFSLAAMLTIALTVPAFRNRQWSGRSG